MIIEVGKIEGVWNTSSSWFSKCRTLVQVEFAGCCMNSKANENVKDPLFNVLTIIQLLNIDLVIVFILVSFFNVFSVGVSAVRHAMTTLYHLLHLLKSVLMRRTVHSFDVV